MNWKIDPEHSSVNFKVRHLGVSWVKGSFVDLKGNLEFDPENIESSKVEVEIPMETINTGNKFRDGHLKSSDFIDLENHPTAKFVSKVVSSKEGGKLSITGDFTLRGVTKEVVLESEFLGISEGPVFEQGAMIGSGHHIAFSATTMINRLDYGVAWNQTLDKGGLAVGEEVPLEIEIEGYILS